MDAKNLLICVTGSRHWAEETAITERLDRLAATTRLALVIEGGCPTGADVMAKEWCDRTGTPHRAFPADWDRYGRTGPDGAGPRRNRDMARFAAGWPGPATLLAFVLPGSRGTLGMITEWKAVGLNGHVIRPKPAKPRSSFDVR